MVSFMEISLELLLLCHCSDAFFMITPSLGVLEGDRWHADEVGAGVVG